MEYVVTLDPNGGVAGSTTSVITVAFGYSGELIAPNITSGLPTRSGYVLTGWNTRADGLGSDFFLDNPNVSPTRVTRDITIYAKWTAQYVVTLNANNGIAGSTTSVAVNAGQTVPSGTSGLPTRSGYVLTGWNTQANGLGSDFVFGTTTVNSHITIYAKWTAQYVVTLNANGGIAGSTTSVAVNAGQTLPSGTSGLPTRSGYFMNGWNTVSNGSGSAFVFGTTPVNGNITIYAQWLPKTLAGLLTASNAVVPSDLASYDAVAQKVLLPYQAGAALVVRYMTPDGGNTSSSTTTITTTDSTYSGTSWADSWRAADLKNLASKASGAADNTIYVLLLRAGEYKAGVAFAMRNNVAIVGGWSGTGFVRSGTTTLSGANSYRVIWNVGSGIGSRALLYGVTIANGKTTDNGGGMYNDNASPTLIQVTFTGNSAGNTGGGMANTSYASPTLIQVTFSGNTARLFENAGIDSFYSSPTLVNSILLDSYNSDGGYTSLNYSITQGAPSPFGSNGLAANGGSVQTIALTASTGSYTNPAINTGLYIKRSGGNYYSSTDNVTWYDGLAGGTGTGVPVPANAIEITATDARGYARSGRPDLGAYEYGGTAP